MKKTPCVYVKDNGEPCGNIGLENYGFMCYPHYKKSKGQDPEKVQVTFTYNYKNGAIGIPGVGKGDILEITPQQFEQVMRDDPHVMVKL